MKRIICLLLTLVIMFISPCYVVAADSSSLVVGSGESVIAENTTDTTITLRKQNEASYRGDTSYTIINSEGKAYHYGNDTSGTTFDLAPGDKIHIMNSSGTSFTIYDPFSQINIKKVNVSSAEVASGESVIAENTTDATITLRKQNDNS